MKKLIVSMIRNAVQKSIDRRSLKENSLQRIIFDLGIQEILTINNHYDDPEILTSIIQV